jgi:hypothetical protein
MQEIQQMVKSATGGGSTANTNLDDGEGEDDFDD